MRRGRGLSKVIAISENWLIALVSLAVVQIIGLSVLVVKVSFVSGRIMERVQQQGQDIAEIKKVCAERHPVPPVQVETFTSRGNAHA